MDLAEAVEKLNTKKCSLHEYAAAGAFVGSYYSSNRHLLRPVLVSDMTPVRTRDQAGVNVSGHEPMPNTENWNAGGARPGSPAGAQLVQELPGPATAYFIANIGPDKCGLFRSSDIEGVLNPGAGNAGSGMQQKLTADQRREIARDESWSRRTLQSINERNKEFWAKEQHNG